MINFAFEHRDEILRAWAAEASKAAAARGLSELELENTIPLCLAALTGEGEGEADSSALGRLLDGHLSDRIRRGFELAEVVEEFAILERCISGVVRAAPPDRRPSDESAARMLLTLHNIMVRTAELYEEHMRLDEQREKRYLRLLRSLADAALRTPKDPLADRLREVMELVAEATAADTAAVCLYDSGSSNLLMKAAVGTAEEELQEFVMSVDPASFTGRIAAHEEPLEVDDIATTELAVTDALRHSGIHSVLGVRLPRHRRFLGVMYIGVREQRPFHRRVIRRLEALGESLTLHLDNARLYAELREHVAELEAERGLRERLTAVLAHDLRGPLAAAKMGLALLDKPGERDEGRPPLIARIDQNLARVDRMLRDLLDISRLRTGEQPHLDLAPCDLRVLADEVVQDLQVVHGARFVVDGGGPVPGNWSCDGLKRALWNLAENGVKYGARGAPITIHVERRGAGACVSVHNLGEPIPPDSQERVFDLFARGRDAQSESWGLGLVYVRACAEAHGGAVSVESDAVSGTTFTLSLPLDSSRAA